MSQPKQLRVLFDGIEVEETPDGWRDITSAITRIPETDSLFITCDAQLTFYGDGYDYLIQRYNDGYCSTVDVELQQFVRGIYRTFHKGKIFLRTAEIERSQCSIRVLIDDSSYYAKIKNNQSLEFFPFAEKTKSGLDIDAADFQTIVLFDPNDGSTIAPGAGEYTRAAYTFYDLFAYAIAFMTDDEVGFDSVLFGVNGDYAGLTLTCGIVLRQALDGGVSTTEIDFKNNFPKISFKELFEEASKKCSLAMFVDHSGSRPVIRIERAGDIRTEALIFTASNVLSVKEYFDTERLYGSIRIGSVTTSDVAYALPETGLLFPEDISFVGPKEEQFAIVCDGTLDKEKDLVSNWIISSNVIEDCLIHGETQYDKDPIMVMCDKAGPTYTAQQANLEGTPAVFPVYYNLNLFGPAVMNNHFGGIPGPIASYLGNSDNTFSAVSSQDYILDDFGGVFTQELLPFQTDVIDASNLWDGQYYSVPSSGLYSFSTSMVIAVSATILTYELYIDRLDAGLSLVSSVKIAEDDNLQHVVVPVDASGSIVASSGDFIRIRIRYLLSTANTPQAARIQAGASLTCTNTSDGGGIYKDFNPEEYPVIKHEWEYPLTHDEFKTIAQNQTGKIEFSISGKPKMAGWIDSLRFKRFSDEKARFITYRSKRLPLVTDVEPEIRMIIMLGQLTDNPFTITPDYYGRPFGGTGTTNRCLFYLAGQNVTVTIPDTHLGVPINSGVAIAITKFNASGSFTTVYTDPTATFTVEPATNYNIQLVYSLTEPGDTYPSLQPTITVPTTPGGNGTLSILLLNPTSPSDFTFLWSTGATTQSILVPSGFYFCTVTNTNPGTFDHNSILFNFNLPVSDTGV